MNTYTKSFFLFFNAVILISCSISENKEVKYFLDASNSIKKELDLLDSAIYQKYMTIFLDLDHPLYGDYSSEEFNLFVSESTVKYNVLLSRVDSLSSSLIYKKSQKALKEIISFQKQGLITYYKEILIQKDIDTALDKRYNEDYQKLQNQFFISQIQLARQYDVHITNSTTKK